MYCEVVERHQLLVQNPMLFDTFEGLLPKRAPKWSINDRFIRYFVELLWKIRNMILPRVFKPFDVSAPDFRGRGGEYRMYDIRKGF